ncbi:MAG TPA: hypothetical protein VG758_22770, partial [Hyphomicrobiaceae bacterium]|nr:hypothetical protein [Hyphomicrobiaceae bacterium]
MRAIDSKGLEEWTQLIESGRLKGPELAEAYFERSNAYPTGNLDGRMADLSKAIEIDPRHHSALFWRGSYHELQKVHDRAVEDYTKAIAIVAEIVAERRQPTLHSWLWARLVSLHRHRGYLYRDAGKYDLAIADATKLIELHADREKHVWPGGDEAGA